MCSVWTYSAIEWLLYVKSNHFMNSLVEAFQQHRRVGPPPFQYHVPNVKVLGRCVCTQVY